MKLTGKSRACDPPRLLGEELLSAFPFFGDARGFAGLEKKETD